MFNKKLFSSVCTFLCFCAMVCALWGCIGFTTDWGLGDASEQENSVSTLPTCSHGYYVLENVSEDSLSGDIIFRRNNANVKLTFSYEFRSDTLILQEKSLNTEDEVVYVLYGGIRGRFVGDWKEDNSYDGVDIWRFTKDSFVVLTVGRDGMPSCVER